MVVKVKKLDPRAVLPSKVNKTDAGFDLVAIDNGTFCDTYIEYKTGISIEIDSNIWTSELWHVEIYPRSSISKMDLILANGVGIIDMDYRGEILLRFKIIQPITMKSFNEDLFSEPCDRKLKLYKAGDRIGQLIIRKTYSTNFVWAEDLTNTKRGTGGFGSTGS